MPPPEPRTSGHQTWEPDARPATPRRYGMWGLLALLVMGLILRAVLAFRDGHLPDVNLFLRWMRGLQEHGLAAFYDEVGCNYPPVYILMLWIEGTVLSWFDPALAHAEMLRAALRIPACAFDTVIAIVLYREGRRLWGARYGLIAATLYYLNPVALYNSAFWGQVDSIHTAGVVLALVALNRGRLGWAGAAIGFGLLQKLQAIAIVPLVLFDAYRSASWRGLGRALGGAGLAAAILLVPFVMNHCAEDALTSGYGVVGQYDRLSINAFNIWQALGGEEIASSSTPRWIIAVAAQGGVEVSDDAVWYLAVSWRTVSIVACGVLFAVILSLYSNAPGPTARFVAAAACILVFFGVLTEMHERYAFPAIALLALWAARDAWRERLFMVLTIVMLLNLEYVESVDRIAADLSWLMIGVTGAVIAWLVSDRWLDPSARPAVQHEEPPSEIYPVRTLVVLFRRLTVGAVVGVALLIGYALIGPATYSQQDDIDHIYLGTLAPQQQNMEYGMLRVDRTLSGGPLYLGHTYYLKGLGTHARATLAYDIPPGVARFTATVGINRHAGGRARVRVRLDDRAVYHSEIFGADDPPLVLDLALGDASCLALDVLPVGKNKGDHVDWALARFE